MQAQIISCFGAIQHKARKELRDGNGTLSEDMVENYLSAICCIKEPAVEFGVFEHFPGSGALSYE